MRGLANVFWLGTKELRSISHDAFLFGFMVYAFTFMIYSQATGVSHELRNASIAIVDQDETALSHAIARAFLPPYFKPPQSIGFGDVDRRMDDSRDTFVVIIPPKFAADVLAGRRPAVQVNVDATAMMQAGVGAGYIEQIVAAEINKFVYGTEETPGPKVEVQIRAAFNPNLQTPWFMGVMALLNNVNMLTIILAGAAVVREREHGTMDHLLVMPLTPFEIAMSKVWANALVITVAVGLSLAIVVKGLLGVPIAGSIPLFLCGTAIYLFFSTAIGIFLATIARTMPQLGLLYILVAVPLNLLSGSNTPLESMPPLLRTLMQTSPSTHFVAFAQAILYRGAGFDIVWPRFLLVGVIGALFLGLALLRFRRVAAEAS